MREFIEIGRDLVILVFGVLGIATVLMVLVLTVSIYRKLGPILDSLRVTLSNAQTTTAMVSDLALRPLMRASSLYAGVRQGLRVILRLRRRMGGR